MILILIIATIQSYNCLGCEYGDQANWCEDLNAYSCYNNHNKDICCAKCEELRENDDGMHHRWVVSASTISTQMCCIINNPSTISFR